MIDLIARAEIIAEIADLSRELHELLNVGSRTSSYFEQIVAQFTRLIEMKKDLGIDPAPEFEGVRSCMLRMKSKRPDAV